MGGNNVGSFKDAVAPYKLSSAKNYTYTFGRDPGNTKLKYLSPWIHEDGVLSSYKNSGFLCNIKGEGK